MIRKGRGNNGVCVIWDLYIYLSGNYLWVGGQWRIGGREMYVKLRHKDGRTETRKVDHPSVSTPIVLRYPSHVTTLITQPLTNIRETLFNPTGLVSVDGYMVYDEES